MLSTLLWCLVSCGVVRQETRAQKAGWGTGHDVLTTKSPDTCTEPKTLQVEFPQELKQFGICGLTGCQPGRWVTQEGQSTSSSLPLRALTVAPPRFVGFFFFLLSLDLPALSFPTFNRRKTLLPFLFVLTSSKNHP